MRLMNVFCFLLASLLLMPITVRAGEPITLIKQTINEVIDILKDEELKKPDRGADRRAELRRVIGERFDFEEMAKPLVDTQL